MDRQGHLSKGQRGPYSMVYRQETANLESASSRPLLCDDTEIYGSHVDVDPFETHARTRSRSLSSPSELGDVDDGDVLTAGGLGLKALQDKTREETSSDIEELLLPKHVSLSTNVEVRIPVSTLTQPRSLFDGAEPPAPQTTEAKAVAVLLDSLKSREPIEGEGFLEFEIDDFSIYIDAPQYPNELRPLQHLNKADRFFFDGILSVADSRLYLKRVPFRELPVGNYGDEHHSVGDQIWIRSILNERLNKEIYYKLGSPSVEYARYYHPFLWIADLAKHVIDYCEHLRTTDRRAVFDVAKVREEDIISTHTVDWFGTPPTSANLFCESRGVSRQSEEFEVGDAVLAQTQSTSLDLENFMLEAFFIEGTKKYVRLRRLLRRRLVDPSTPKAPLNELVYSERLIEIEAKSIARRCLVRVFRTDERIPAPYDRNGTGDAFFITHQELATGDGKTRFVPVDPGALSLLRQGFNPNCTAKSERLRGLDLFCGGGNFGRGLEDGGAIQMRWANDIWGEAIHTYMANTTPGTCTPFLGSVDDLLRQALLGSKKTPRPGEVDFISGGSPCPGFSLLTHDKTTDKQRKNQSLVASFASYVDLYRPQYGLLENVVQMVQSKHNRDECVFSQLVSAIVGLGYQTQILFLDAWSFGASQSRSRVFLMFAAPGLRVPKAPIPTHSRPDVPLRKLGLMSNGQSFSQREHLPTPFKFVSAMEATGDLPDIQDSKADYCVGFPDHRLTMGYTPTLRKQVQHIPTQPWGMSFSKAYYGGSMDESTRQLYPMQGKARVSKISRGWGRIEPNSVFPTITTTCCPTDARVGQINHWYQPRPITILEARRAQGFLDSEVLVGSALNQYRIVGNSVARQVALALGLAIREAWFGTMLDEKPVPQNAADNDYVITKSIEAGLGAPSGPILLDSSSDEQSAGVSEPLPRETPLTTPAISDMSERTGPDARGKRTSTFYVEVVAKRHRPTIVNLGGYSVSS
ncbi:hypothetical protein DL764_010519 [Monosporascus ibericus]|uniref:DNA (cytosine-5-)-methyltransferase n=1 Tax=Monosporascus ibericus TaxID=155417 RepID=A0A4Q4SVC1_9PEZI|nr:hypothetical protein DL764_010519 [Monosporascus ibericus]